jgi:hypothetical protein
VRDWRENKGEEEVGESKKEQDKLVKIACPWGRMRGETPKREWDKSELRLEESNTRRQERRLFVRKG